MLGTLLPSKVIVVKCQQVPKKQCHGERVTKVPLHTKRETVLVKFDACRVFSVP